MSAKHEGFIPRPDADFDRFYRNLTDYVLDYAARWKHIPADDVDGLEADFSDWTAAWEKTLVPHIPQLTAEKTRVRIAKERALRGFTNRFLRWPPVTDLDRDKMGVRNPDTIRTPHVSVAEVVELELGLRNIREIIVTFWVKGETHRAKPSGYDGAVIVWDVLDTPPQRIGDLHFHTMASRTPHPLSFDETERGKTAYIAASWQNERGLIGAWSEILSAVIP